MHSHESHVARQIATAVAGQRGALLGRARYLVGPCEAEDLVQSTIERALLHLDSFSPDSNLIGWLKRIMTNLATDEWRRHRPFGRVELDPALMYREEDGARASWEDLTAADVRAAARGLSADFRQVFELHHHWGLPYVDIARQLHLPLGTVGSRLKRAREQLRQVLTDLLVRRAEGEAGAEPAFAAGPGPRPGRSDAAHAPRPGRLAPPVAGSPAPVVAVA